MASKTKIVFFGTPSFAVQIFDELKQSGILPDLVVTNPDEPQGRKLILTPPPVKEWALGNNIPIIQPKNLKTIPTKLINDFDLFLVVAYGKIIPETVLKLPKFGTLNVHPSLLPKYRGPSPIQHTILNGDKEAGISIMLLDKEMDHGPILAEESIDISTSNPYISDLRNVLSVLAGKTLSNIIPKWTQGKMGAIPQDHSKATYVKKIEKDDGYIDSKIILDTDNIDRDTKIMAWRKVRAFTPDPSAYTVVEHNSKRTRLKITRGRMEGENFVIEKVIPDGKKEMDFEDWKRGNLKSQN